MYLGIDYGRKRIGLALGVMMPRTAGIVDGSKLEPEILAEIEKIATENEAEAIIIGLPIRSMGEEGTLAGEIRLFAEKISNQCQLPIYFEEEQYTSAEAEQILKETGDCKDKSKIDEVAAVLLLEQFISRLNNNGLGSLTPDIVPRGKENE